VAIDYDSGAGLFDKLGVLVRAINIFETFETGSLATAMSELLGKMEEANSYDENAKTLFFQIDNEFEGQLVSFRQRMLSMIQPIIQQELDEEEDFYSSDLTAMLDFLIWAMNRDVQTVDQSTITLTGPAAGTPAPTGNFSIVASDFASTVQGADASSQENGIIHSNQYKIWCINNQVSGAELFQVQGNFPRSSNPAHKNFENAGSAGTLPVISSISNTILRTGGFETLSGSAFSDWSIVAGVWNTDLIQDNTSPYRETYRAKVRCSAANPRIRQTLADGTLQPYSKYLLSFKAIRDVASDGTLNIGFIGDTVFYARDVATQLTAAWAIYSYIFNTGAAPVQLNNFDIQLTGGVTNNFVYLDEVCLTQMSIVRGTGISVIGGNTDPALDDFWTLGVVNNHEGTFMKFFGRYLNVLLPGNAAGAETILDALAE